jgi:hypothetical protein
MENIQGSDPVLRERGPVSALTLNSSIKADGEDVPLDDGAGLSQAPDNKLGL